MLRKLLACLALLTGLAAAGAPAHAEVARVLAAPVAASAAGDSSIRAGAVHAAVAIRHVVPCAQTACSRATADVPPTPVRLKSDRARE